jgi:hypothetical protein
MCRGSVAACAALLMLVVTPDARADALSDARKAVDGSDYVAARAALQQALTAGTAGPAELSEIYKLSGIVEGALGSEKSANEAFTKWLSLDPKGALPVGTSPKIMRPFTAALEQTKKRGSLEAMAETADDPPSVTLVVVNDPLKLIVGAKVLFKVDKGPEQSLEADGTERITLELGVGKRIDLRVQGVDRHGNRVVELGSKDVPIVITSSGQTKKIVDPNDKDLLTKKKQPEPEEPRPWHLQWWVWGIATGVATGTAGYFAWRTYDGVQELHYLNDNSLAHRFSEAQDVESRARRDLLITNITAGVAGAFAIGTAILFFTRPTVGERSASVAVTPFQGGGTLVLGGRF